MYIEKITYLSTLCQPWNSIVTLHQLDKGRICFEIYTSILPWANRPKMLGIPSYAAAWEHFRKKSR